jgi:hypothetical protein
MAIKSFVTAEQKNTSVCLGTKHLAGKAFLRNACAMLASENQLPRLLIFKPT